MFTNLVMTSRLYSYISSNSEFFSGFLPISFFLFTSVDIGIFLESRVFQDLSNLQKIRDIFLFLRNLTG